MSLGADEIVDYRTEKFEEILKDFDVVFDVLAYKNEAKTMESGVLKSSGHYIHIAASDWDADQAGYDCFKLAIPEARPERVLKSIWSNIYYGTRSLLGYGAHYHGPVFVHPNGSSLQEFMKFVEQGLIRPVVDQTFSLENTADAHVYLEAGHAKGKVVIVVRKDQMNHSKQK